MLSLIDGRHLDDVIQNVLDFLLHLLSDDCEESSRPRKLVTSVAIDSIFLSNLCRVTTSTSSDRAVTFIFLRLLLSARVCKK